MEYAAAISDFLQSFHWDYFITLTPKRPRTDAIAYIRDTWEQFDRLYVGRAFLACEPFKYQRNLHVHGLVSYLNPWRMPNARSMQGYFDKFGRSRIEDIEAIPNVTGYCTKYASKWSDGDNYDFCGDWSEYALKTEL